VFTLTGDRVAGLAYTRHGREDSIEVQMPSSQPEEAIPTAPAIRLWAVRRWPMWETPRRLLMALLVVEATSLGLVVAVAAGMPPPDVAQMLQTGVLVALGLAHTEIALAVERIRRRVTTGNHTDLSSVWTFAGALVLPPACAVVVAIVLQFHIWVRTGRPRVLLYRSVFTTATVVLACLAASGVVAFLGSGSPPLVGAGLPGAVLALLVYTTVNTALVAGAIAMSAPQPDLTRVLGRWDDGALEIATLSLGALAAVALIINPWLVVLVLPPLLVLHRAVLVRHLEEMANTDGKTGLLNAAAWHSQAERALRRSVRDHGPGGVLVLDLDHFKAVNDTHGHLAGDQVLVAVAGALRAEVRERDLVGRFGGEEFVVLLAGLGSSGSGELEAVAERIRRRVANLRVEVATPDGPLTIAGFSVSVGAAVDAEDNADLQALLHVADAALYAAKRAGRNTVRMGVAVPAAPSAHGQDQAGNSREPRPIGTET
jgi:diguanylate cyclase (GGDEF)-like protein